jgi:hypothetical protein
VEKSDLASYALIPSFGGTGQTYQLFDLPAGARLPGVPQQSVTIAADYVVIRKSVRTDTWSLRLHVDGAYRGWASGDINEMSPFYWREPSSVIANARAVLDVSHKTSLDLFVNNLTSATAYSGAQNVQTIPNPYSFLNVARPRTIGVTLQYRY